MDVDTYLTAINAPGVNAQHVEWQTEVKPAAAYREHRLTKVSAAMVMTGVEYRNLSATKDLDTGELPWGEWAMYPYVVQHKGALYFRLYTIDHTVRTRYFVDGTEVDRDSFGAYLTPSQRNAKRPTGGTITVKAENVRLVGEPALA